MVNVFRFLTLGLLSVLIGTGLIGCAVFSAGAQEMQQSVHKSVMSAAPSGYQHHSGHTSGAASMPASHEHGPAHGDHESHCDGCGQTLLNRISIAPDQAMSAGSEPQPVFIVLAALQLGVTPHPSMADEWPPGHSPPAAPRTLTHQKISLLI